MRLNLNKALIAAPLLSSMTRNELRETAHALGVKCGKSRTNTLVNLNHAVADGKAQIKLVGYIYAPNSLLHPQSHGPAVFIKKLRTYKPDKVLLPVTKPD